MSSQTQTAAALPGASSLPPSSAGESECIIPHISSSFGQKMTRVVRVSREMLFSNDPQLENVCLLVWKKVFIIWRAAGFIFWMGTHFCTNLCGSFGALSGVQCGCINTSASSNCRRGVILPVATKLLSGKGSCKDYPRENVHCMNMKVHQARN